MLTGTLTGMLLEMLPEDSNADDAQLLLLPEMFDSAKRQQQLLQHGLGEK